MEINFVPSYIHIILLGVLVGMLSNLMPTAEYSPFSVDPAVELQGTYALNTVLNDAEHLYSGLIKGPESIVVLDDELYTGVHGGDVVKLSKGNIEKVVNFGQPCAGQWEEKICGRPFGLTPGKDGDLYIGDAYYGIWKYNVRDKTQECIVSQNTSIDGRIPKLFNSVIVTDDGDIYWTDTSTDVEIQNGFYAMFMDGSGRLLKYSAKSKENQVILDNLYFPNGIVMSPNKHFIVIAEMITSRLIRHYIEGPHEGKSDIFLNQLPGFPDKLKVCGEYILVPLVHARDKSEPVFFQSISARPWVRKCIVKMMAIVEHFLEMLNSIVPSTFIQKWIHKIGHFETVSIFAPQRATVLVVNWSGEVVASWHNLDGTLAAISDVQIHQGFIYYGSPYNQYIGRTQIPKKEGEDASNENHYCNF